MSFKHVDEAFTKAWLSNKFVVLDTETTGLRYPAEIVQICVLDFMGDRIVDTYVMPHNLIPYEATNIHGITNEMVAKAPSWPDVRNQVIEALRDKHLFIYNANYDLQMLRNSDKLWGIYFDWTLLIKELHCAMLWYADFYGEWDTYRGANRWQKLTAACQQRNITVEDAHDAHGDCILTHKLVTSIMAQRAAEAIIYSTQDEIVCTHPVIDTTANGSRQCRDCGFTWEV